VQSHKKFNKKEYAQAYRLKNKEKIQAYNKQYRETTRENAKKYWKKYAIKNKALLKIKNQKYRTRNKEILNKKDRERYALNPHLKNERGKKYYRKHSKSITARTGKYEKEKAKNDPAFRLMRSLRERLRGAIKLQRAHKGGKIKEILGESCEFVRQYIEAKFKDGMTWENYGYKGWHIDHIIPMSSFNLFDPEQLKKCCHYTNLQPLWWWENLAKSNKIPVDPKL